jgi:hypothetical protein
MAGGLYQRVAARGFPSSVAAGMTGAGALESQGGPYDPAHGDTSSTGTTTQTLEGFRAEGAAPVAVELIEGTWGLPGTLHDPDRTPRTHAAPVPEWAGNYNDGDAMSRVREDSTLIHSVDFGALAGHTQVDGVASTPMDTWEEGGTGETAAQQLAGQIRYMGGYDGQQGYGGGADGPGGTNSHGFADVRRSYLRLTEPQPMIYIDPAERPFIVPQASGSFIPADQVQGPEPFESYWDAGDVTPDPPSAYQAPPEPETLATPLASAAVSSGWWGG